MCVCVVKAGGRNATFLTMKAKITRRHHCKSTIGVQKYYYEKLAHFIVYYETCCMHSVTGPMHIQVHYLASAFNLDQFYPSIVMQVTN